MLPDFTVERPGSLDEAIALLERLGDDAAFYMGGTELLLLMKLGMADASVLVSGKRLAELRGIERTESVVRIGAGHTYREIERSIVIRAALPSLATLASEVANLRVRNVGTLGGNLCFAEPHSDPATLLVALGAKTRLTSVTGERTLSLEQFVTGPLTTARRDGEVMTRIDVPVPAPDAAVGYYRVKFRERPVVNVAVVSNLDAPRVVVGAVGGRPCRVPTAEELLAAESPIQEVAAAAGAAIEPIVDLDGDVEYKRHLVEVATKRACMAAGLG